MGPYRTNAYEEQGSREDLLLKELEQISSQEWRIFEDGTLIVGFTDYGNAVKIKASRYCDGTTLTLFLMYYGQPNQYFEVGLDKEQKRRLHLLYYKIIKEK